MTDLNEIFQQAAMHAPCLVVCESKIYPVRQETKGYGKNQFTWCEHEIGQALILHADSKFQSPDISKGKVAHASARVGILVLDYSASKSVGK